MNPLHASKIEIEDTPAPIPPMSLIEEALNKATHKPTNGYRTYYTCVRHINIPTGVMKYAGEMGDDVTVFGRGQWSCTEGNFDIPSGGIGEKPVEVKNLSYCSFTGPRNRLAKDISEPFVFFENPPKIQQK